MKDITLPLVKLILALSSSIKGHGVGKFIYLLIGVILNPGHVTNAIEGVGRERNWSAAYKFINRDKWSYLSLARKMSSIIVSAVLPRGRMYFSLDDTVNYRCSKKAPGCKYHYNHAKKVNRSEYVLGQSLVVFTAVFNLKDRGNFPIPLISRLCPTPSNSSKLKAALVIWRSIGGCFNTLEKYLLVDAWFMRKILIQSFMNQGVNVIGQVRINTALFTIPKQPRKRKRGAPRKYGSKLTIRGMNRRKLEEVELKLYNRNYRVHYFSLPVVVRFLKGIHARAVWVKLEDLETGIMDSKFKLFLSTDLSLTAQEIIQSYEQRWSIESFFNQIKNFWELRKAWQQDRQSFARWIQILFAAYFIPAFLLVFDNDYAHKISAAPPWRKDGAMTVGILQKGLQRLLRTSGLIDNLVKVAKNNLSASSYTYLKPTIKNTG
jgi:hypothetical protein